MKKYVIGLDVGTSSTKALLLDSEGKLCGSSSAVYPMSTPQVGYSEQDPEDWKRAVTKMIRSLCASPDVSDHVTAIAMSVQGGTAVFADEKGAPVRSAIVWNDSRCDREAELFTKEVGSADRMYRLTGWHLGKTLLPLEIRWIRDHEPETFRKTARFLSVPDYLSLWLTGKAALDVSNGGINQTVDICAGTYAPELLKFAGIEEDKLPEIIPSGEIIGNLKKEAAKELGLTESTVLVSGAHDQYAAAIGAGALKPGDVCIGSGTSWVVTAMRENPDFESGLSISRSAIPGLWGSIAVLSSGGASLEWVRRQISGGEPVSFERINSEAQKRAAAEEGLFFYPFSGRRPAFLRSGRAAFLGLDPAHDGFSLCRAVMEGVAFQIAWMLDEMGQAAGKGGIRLSGGAAKSDLWCEILASACGIPVRVPSYSDLGCVGAAILAGTGGGLFSSAEDGYGRIHIPEKVVVPDGKLRNYLMEYQQK